MFARIFMSIFALIIATSNAHAWSREGHRAICQAAYELAEHSTRAEIDRLMLSLPGPDRQALAEYVHIDPADITFADTCAWADAVKNWSQYRKIKNWHYINTDRDTDTYQDKDCQNGCVLKGIEFYAAKLSDVSETDWEHLKALMFLGHFIGDAHQPLHTGFADDLDGNKTYVRGAHMDCNQLHSMWDRCLIQKNGENYALLASDLVRDIRRSNAIMAEGGAPKSWINESMALARSPVVNYCVQQGDGSCVAIPPDNGISYQLPEDYFDQVWPVAKNRLEQASVRLALELNQRLGDG